MKKKDFLKELKKTLKSLGDATVKTLSNLDKVDKEMMAKIKANDIA